MKKKNSEIGVFSQSWQILRNNKILVLPNLIILLINLILFTSVIAFSGLGKVLVENRYLEVSSVLTSGLFIGLFLGYLILSLLIDNYFLTLKYGLIKEVLLKRKASWSNGLNFAKKHYFSTLGIHVLSFLLIFVPLELLALLLFFLLPLSSLLALSIFIPLALVYIVYLSVRLIFVYPVMVFEKEGAYKSLRDDFHFVKTHLHHTILTWLIVIGVTIALAVLKQNSGYVNQFFYNQVLFLGILGTAVILAIEVAVSAWEHIFIFKSYLLEKKEK